MEAFIKILELFNLVNNLILGFVYVITLVKLHVKIQRLFSLVIVCPEEGQ